MLSNATRLRRTVAGLCLLTGPVLLLAGNVLGTRGPTTPAAYLDAIAGRPAANEASIVVTVYGFLLMIGAVLGLLHLLRHRAVTLGHIGGGLLILGLVSFAFVAGTEYINIAASSPEADRSEMLALNTRVGESFGYNLINATEIVGYLFGTIILGIALAKARIISKAFALMLITGIVLRFFGAAQFWLVFSGDLLMVAAYGCAGITVLRKSDEQWCAPLPRTQ